MNEQEYKSKSIERDPDSFTSMDPTQLLIYLFPANLQDLRQAAKKLRIWVAPEKIGEVGAEEQLLIQAFRVHLAEIEFIMELGDEIFEIGQLYENQTDSLPYVLQLMRGFCDYYLNCRLRFCREAEPLIDEFLKAHPEQASEVIDLAMNIVIETIMSSDHPDGGEDGLSSIPFISPEDVDDDDVNNDYIDSLDLIKSLNGNLNSDLAWIEAHQEISGRDVSPYLELDVNFFAQTNYFLNFASRILQELNEKQPYELTSPLLYAFSQFCFAANALYESFIEDLETRLNERRVEPEPEPASTDFSDEVRRIIEERWNADPEDAEGNPESTAGDDEDVSTKSAKRSVGTRSSAKKTTTSSARPTRRGKTNLKKPAATKSRNTLRPIRLKSNRRSSKPKKS